MGLMSRIAKKIARRFRKKGTFWEKPSKSTTIAEWLIMNNWNITFSNPEPKRAGLLRAAERAAKKHKENAEKPKFDNVLSRQVIRAMGRHKMKQYNSAIR